MDILSKLLLKKKGKSKKPKKLKEYSVTKVIGMGSYGTVKEAVRIKDDVRCAIKIIKKSKIKKNENLIKRELTILNKINHPHIIKLYEWFETHSKYYLVFQLASGGELFNRICDQVKFSERDAAIIISTAIASVAFLHSKGIVHRDIKPENLLFLDEGMDKLVLVDFGISKIIEGPTELLTTVCGSPGYTAPEILKGKSYSKPVDMWSIGVITYILLSGYSPFYYCSDSNQLYDAIIHGRYYFEDNYWHNISSYAKDFVRTLLQIDPDKRATAEEALDHPWLNNLCPKHIKHLKKQNETKFDKKSYSSKMSLKSSLSSKQENEKLSSNEKLASNEKLLSNEKLASNEKLGETDNDKINIKPSKSTVSFADLPPKVPSSSTISTDNTKLNQILKDDHMVMVNEPRIMTNYAKGDNLLNVPEVVESDNGSSTAYVSSQKEDNESRLSLPNSNNNLENGSVSDLDDEYIETKPKAYTYGSVSYDLPELSKEREEVPLSPSNKNYSTQSLPTESTKNKKVNIFKNTINRFTDTRHMSLANIGHKEKENASSSTIDEALELPELLPDEFYIANIDDNEFTPQLPCQTKKRRRKHKKSEHEDFCMEEKKEKSVDPNGEVSEVTSRSVENLPDSVCSSKEAVYCKSNQSMAKKDSSFSKLSNIVSDIIAKEKEKDMEKEKQRREDEDNIVSAAESKKDTAAKSTERVNENGIYQYKNESEQSVNTDSTCSCCKSAEDGEDEDDEEEDNLPNLLSSDEYRNNFIKRRFQKAVRRVHMLNRWRSYSHSSFETSSMG